MKNDWRSLKLQDKVIWSWKDFDGSGSLVGTVIEIHENHLLILADDQVLWLDDSNSDMFEK